MCILSFHRNALYCLKVWKKEKWQWIFWTHSSKILINDTDEPLFPLIHFSLPRGWLKKCLMGCRVKRRGKLHMITQRRQVNGERWSIVFWVIEYNGISSIPYCTKNYQRENMEKQNPGVKGKTFKKSALCQPSQKKKSRV